MKISTLTVSVFATNCYLVYDGKAEEGVVIDPGDEGDRIKDEISRLNFKPVGILLTHGHGDHIGAVADLKAEYDATIYAGPNAERVIRYSNKEFFSAVGLDVSCPMPDTTVVEDDIISFGDYSLRVIETPGHSLDAICFHAGNSLFCGDTLFFNSIGRTDLGGGNHDQLIDSINEKLLVLPDETVCYTGHGPRTTIGQERKNNPFLIGSFFD